MNEGQVNYSLLVIPFNGVQIDPLTAMLNKKIQKSLGVYLHELLVEEETV
jgi:hypothetical protein